MKYLELRNELATTEMVNIFEKYSKFKILKDTITSLSKNEKTICCIYVETLNYIFKTIIEMLNDKKDRNKFYEWAFDFYFSFISVKMFQRNINLLKIYKKSYVFNFRKDILEYWNELKLNNNINKEKRDFIKMFDEVHDLALINNKDIFIKDYKYLSDLYRCAKEKEFKEYDRMIPKAEYVTDNRWNPDHRVFLYLSNDNGEKIDHIPNGIKTCFEEIRLKDGEYSITCKFKILNKKMKLLNLNIDENNLKQENERLKEHFDVSEIMNDEKFFNKLKELKEKGKESKIRNVIEKKVVSYSDKKFFERFIGTTLIYDIVKAIFLPVYKEKNPKLEAYIPFRLFAEYLIDKGYDGLIYKSTRMDVIGEKGENVVLFNAEDATYIERSMELYKRQNGNDIKIK
ncbi:RES domain-containing protein [Clostridium perfringens]|uniref:RES domain-containing protein n=1 Tax=Clostridium perfringens TaxID=1502 RepID=UPI0018E4A8F0|nr:RES domain-containing protein [Clostridium perfringens]MBI6111428.1 RES domain-containing protein [Clostridium perfringens]MBI6114634.1 RES domain-containing protein [Clostridium perfringens]